MRNHTRELKYSDRELDPLFSFSRYDNSSVGFLAELGRLHGVGMRQVMARNRVVDLHTMLGEILEDWTE